MLVQVALIVFAMCATLSLIIDIGYARVTQGQMQNAADAAAIEGIRQRGVVVPEAARRAAVNNVVGWTFDEDYDSTNADVDYQFGAGPIIDLTEGVTTLHGLQTASVPDIHVYKPNLQPNLDNAPEGDMVSGRFCYNADPVRSEDVAYELQDTVCGQPQQGTGAYARNDFNPGVGNGNAFLVRLRRSNEFQDLEGQMEPDVASSGPSLPLTFGKATTIHADDPTATYSVRRDGLTVRATAIAETRPALHLGVPQANPATPALTPFVVADVCAGNATGAPVNITVTVNPTSGLITRTGAGTPGCAGGAVVGRFVANTATLRTVGAALPVAPLAITCQSVNSFAVPRYGPVFSQMSTGPNRIVGFARITWTRTAVCPALNAPFAATISRLPSSVAAVNATAMLPDGFATGVPAALLAEVMDKNLGRNGGVNYGPLLVPVLAR